MGERFWLLRFKIYVREYLLDDWIFGRIRFIMPPFLQPRNSRATYPGEVHGPFTLLPPSRILGESASFENDYGSRNPPSRLHVAVGIIQNVASAFLHALPL